VRTLAVSIAVVALSACGAKTGLPVADADCAAAPACCVPSAETCNGLDDDCDGVADDGVRCFVLNGTERIASIRTSACAADWYAYGSPATSSANPSPDIRSSGGIEVAVHEGPPACGGASLALIADQVDDGSGGTLVGTFTLDPAIASAVVLSDEPDECRYAAGTATCDWTWQPCCTDGVVLGPFPGDFCVDVALSGLSGVRAAVDVHDGPSRTVAAALSFEICGTTIPAVP